MKISFGHQLNYCWIIFNLWFLRVMLCLGRSSSALFLIYGWTPLSWCAVLTAGVWPFWGFSGTPCTWLNSCSAFCFPCIGQILKSLLSFSILPAIVFPLGSWKSCLQNHQEEMSGGLKIGKGWKVDERAGWALSVGRRASWDTLGLKHIGWWWWLKAQSKT